MRGTALGTAAILLALLWLAPLERWLPGFPLHMVRHMGLVAIVAPLLVLGAPALGLRLGINPILAAAIEFVVVWGWHLPRLHGAARTAPLPFAAEQASFLVAGLLVWAGCLGARQPLAGAGGLLLTSMHMTLLGALLTLAPRDLYAAWCGTLPDVGAQQAGGLVMLAIGTPVYLLAGLWLTSRGLAARAPA